MRIRIIIVLGATLITGCAFEPAKVQPMGGGNYMATATAHVWEDAKVKAVDAANAYCAKNGGATILKFEPSSDSGMNRESAIFTCQSSGH
jgi:hypothetical protein